MAAILLMDMPHAAITNKIWSDFRELFKWFYRVLAFIFSAPVLSYTFPFFSVFFCVCL